MSGPLTGDSGVRLVVFRHAKAKQLHPDGDYARPLSEKGIAFAELQGQRLHGLVGMPDRIIASAAVRTAETAQILAESCGFPQEGIECYEALYDAGTDEWISRIEGFASPDSRHPDTCVCLVGHNPTISSLVSVLSGEECYFRPGEGVILRAATWNDAGNFQLMESLDKENKE